MKKNFVRIYRTGELDDDGVLPVWRWECEHFQCMYRTSDHGTALYWENVLNQANRHIKWHKDYQNT